MSRYRVGDSVTVRRAFPPGHVRTPGFVRGKDGVIAEIAGAYPNPEELAYGRPGTPMITLYRVRFRQRDLWNDYDGPELDTAVVDVFEHWLEPAGPGQS